MTRRQNYFGQIILAADLTVVIGCYFAAYWTRLWMWHAGYPVLPIGRASANSWVITVALGGWIVAGRYYSLYNPITYKSVSHVLAASIKAQTLAAILILTSVSLLRGFGGTSRPLLALLLMFGLLSSLVERLIIVLVMRYRWRLQRPATVWRVLLVGSRDDAESYLHLVREHPEWNLEIVGIVPAIRNNVPENRVSGDLYSTIQ